MCTVLLDEWWEAMRGRHNEGEDNDEVSRECRGSVGLH